MSKNDHWISMAQLAFKAGKAVYGSQLIPSIQSGSVKLVLMADDCGKNTQKKLRNKTHTYQIPLAEVPSLQMESIRHRAFSALGICDRGFAENILESLKKVGDDDGLQQTASKEKTQ